jgi:hypothetical protein
MNSENYERDKIISDMNSLEVDLRKVIYRYFDEGHNDSKTVEYKTLITMSSITNIFEKLLSAFDDDSIDMVLAQIKINSKKKEN